MSFIDNIATILLSKKESKNTVKQFFSWNELKSILIISHENQLSNIVDFINTCEKHSIETNVAIIYNGKVESIPKPHFKHVILIKKDFSFFNLPKQEILNSINAKPYNLLINLAENKDTQSFSLSKLISASCKISRFQNYIYDITIEKTHTTTEFLNQVVIYLNMIKTK